LLAAIIAIAFMMIKVSTVWLGCYLTNMTARDSLLIATTSSPWRVRLHHRQECL
jgi:hypothetical protein